MKITRKYIMDNRTDRGAWTKPQIEALGIDWPPRKGWIDRVVGKEISERSRCEFESRMGVKQARRESRAKMSLVLDMMPKAGFFEDRKAKALQKYEERKAVETVDRETVTKLREWL